MRFKWGVETYSSQSEVEYSIAHFCAGVLDDTRELRFVTDERGNKFAIEVVEIKLIPVKP